MTTLDGKKYTFNGHGEYVLLDAKDTVLVHARTAPAWDSEGNDTKATVFTAFASLEEGASKVIQLEMDETRTGGSNKGQGRHSGLYFLTLSQRS